MFYCVSPEGISGPAVQNLCLVHHWIRRRQNIRHTASAQLIFAAWMIACLVQFSLCSLGQEHTPTVYKQPLEAAGAGEEGAAVGRKVMG